MNISKSALNSLITHLQRVVERAKAEPKDCRTQDALRVTWENTVGGALNFADMLIAKLKEQSE